MPLTDSQTSSDWLAPPRDRAGREAWMDNVVDEVAKVVTRELRRIVLEAYEAFLGTLTASGDLTALDSIPTQWRLFVESDLGPVIGDLYTQGSMGAWLQASEARNIPAAVGEGVANVVNQSAVDYQRTATNRLVGIGDDVWGDVRFLTVNALGEDGVTTEALKGQIEDITGMSEYRADTIARTETHQAVTAGDRRAAEALGEYGPVEHVWVAARDARTRESHAAAHNQVRPFGEPFDVGGVRMMRPGDGPVGEIVNCRCYEETLYPGDTRPDGTVVEDPVADGWGEFDAGSAGALAVASRGIPEDGWDAWPEAEAWLNARHPHVRWDSGMGTWDRRSVRDTAQWADRMDAQYHDQWQKMRYVGDQQGPREMVPSPSGRDVPVPEYRWQGGTFAHAYTGNAEMYGSGIIGVNPQYARDYELWQRMMTRSKDQGWLARGEPGAVLDHEFGHIFDGLTKYELREQVGGLPAFGPVSADGFEMVSTQLDSLSTAWQKVMGPVSKYGTSNNAESFAEAFSIHVVDPTSPYAAVVNARLRVGDYVQGLAENRPGSGHAARRVESLERIEEWLRTSGVEWRPRGLKTFLSRARKAAAEDA